MYTLGGRMDGLGYVQTLHCVNMATTQTSTALHLPDLITGEDSPLGSDSSINFAKTMGGNAEKVRIKYVHLERGWASRRVMCRSGCP